MGNLSMSVGNNIIDASRDLIISVGHNITYLSIKYYPDYLIHGSGDLSLIVGNNLQMRLMI
jgi:CO dehydrogenase/acetyl-CoA synthase alpha subunit